MVQPKLNEKSKKSEDRKKLSSFGDWEKGNNASKWKLFLQMMQHTGVSSGIHTVLTLLGLNFDLF